MFKGEVKIFGRKFLVTKRPLRWSRMLWLLCEHFMCHATSSISANAGALKPACSRKGACVRACVLVRRQQPDRTGTAQDMPCSSDIRHRQGRCVRPERLIRAVLAATGTQTK